MADRLGCGRISRRGFLGYASAGAASVLWPRVARSVAADRLGAAAGAASLSMGYSEAANPDGLSQSFTTSAARSLSRGDLDFAQTGARVALTGIMLPEGHPQARTVRSASLFLHYAVPGIGEPVQVQAWRLVTSPVCNLSPGSRCFVPVSPETGLTISVDLELDSSGVEHFEEELVLSELAGRSKLLEGAYFVPLGYASEDRILDWSHYVWRADPEFSPVASGQAARRRLVDATGELAGFPYVAMTVQHAERVGAIQA